MTSLVNRGQHGKASKLNIKIKVSENMTEYSGIYTNESGVIRIPKVLRHNLGLELGQQLQLVTVDKEPLSLKVGQAYADDVIIDDGICYVSRDVFELVNIEGTEQYKVTPIEGITLGCDPEFFLVDNINRKVLRAYSFFKKYGEIGHDGILAELRPRPSLTPQGLTDNIFKLILNTREMLNRNTTYDPERIMMLAASGYQRATAGFHLHFGLPSSILGRTPNIIILMHQMVRVMDYYVGLPAIMLEGDHDSARRSNIFVNYGKPSDFRLDNRTLEYRVAGGSMLRHPILTKGLIALGEIVTQDITSKVKLNTNDFTAFYWVNKDERFQEMYPDVLSTPDVYKLICSPTVEPARQHLDRVYAGTKNMIGYERRREEIDEFFTHIFNNTQFNNDIEYNWRNFYEQATKLCQPPSQDTAFSAGS